MRKVKSEARDIDLQVSNVLKGNAVQLLVTIENVQIQSNVPLKTS